MNNKLNIKRITARGFLMLLLSGIILMMPAGQVFAQGPGPGPGAGPGGDRQFMDSRHNLNRSYPARDQYVNRIPGANRVVTYHSSRYYFADDVWYRPMGGRFIVVAPPIGMFIPFLPAAYVTIWVNGIPYYYANEVYYTSTAGGYVVAEPPKDEVSTTPPAAETTSDRLFIYPRQGQSAKQQADDRYECHTWAVSQTSYDPVKPPSGVSAGKLSQMRSDYQRAMGACLEGRGYTVK